MKENFSKRLKNVLKYSKEDAIRLGHSYVGSEHLLLGLLKEKSGISKKIFDLFDVDAIKMASTVEDLVKSSKSTMTLGHLPLTRRAERILRNAYEEAVSRNDQIADDEHLLLSILKENDGIAYEALKSFNVDSDTVNELLDGEQIQTKTNNYNKKDREDSLTPTIDHFSIDLTKLAKLQSLDPVIGRDIEIDRVAQILSCRKKNNPVLIGEPGVGKTAIVEGLAQRIVNKRTPSHLFNKRVLCLDLPAVISGTKYRGQFEERMKSIMSELENNKDIIVFIDEIHNIVGAGGASGSIDASNMFKPSLARGDLSCIGATTIDEYRKYIEKDGALDRRLQKITVEEPSENESVQILLGLKEKYEIHHNVIYSDESINACVYLSSRYINDRFLPDKAIDIMDEAGARSRMLNFKIPHNIIKIEKELEKIKDLKNQKVSSQLFEKAAELRDSEKKVLNKLHKAKKRWENSKENNIIKIGESNISDVISLKTGIPMKVVAQSESQKILNLHAQLSKSIFGQDKAIRSISNSIMRARTGLKSENKPIGVFLFLGPTGVGKTELVKVLAKSFYSTKNSLIKIDMSEFSEKFSLSRLIGSPPGYIGYEAGGELTEKVRNKPFSIILLDEIEKAHNDLYNLMLQVFDEGVLTDSMGRCVDFSNTIIIMTSNLGSKFKQTKNLGFFDNHIDNKDEILKDVGKVFSPEFLNRIDEKVIFNNLNEKDIYKIIDFQIKDLKENLKIMDIDLKIRIKAKRIIAKLGFDENNGARPLKRKIQNLIENKISELILENELKSGMGIEVSSINEKLDFKVLKK